jgi:hypothetical protein
VDNVASTGITLPADGATVHVNGILANNDVWLADALFVAKPDDIYLVTDIVSSLAGARAKGVGESVGMVKALATVSDNASAAGCVYVEDPARTCGLRLHGTLPTGLGAIGTGDYCDFHGTVAETAQGEKYIECDVLQRSISPETTTTTGCTSPIEAIGMNNRDACSAKALGLLVKTWGKVSAVGSDNFTMSDGSPNPIKVMCGSLPKPAVNDVVRVRGVMSKDASGPIMYMRNERVDWTTGDANFQPLPFPGAFGYARDFLVLGPFADANSTDETYRLTEDFISDGTGGAVAESTIATAAPPALGGTLAGKTWTRAYTDGDHVVFTTGTDTYCTFYVHIWVYAPSQLDLAMRVGSDDCSKVIVTGYLGSLEVYATTPVVGRSEAWGADPIGWVPLAEGWNSVLLKCENGTGPCAMDIQFVDSGAMGDAGWGGAPKYNGLGYLLTKP